MSKRILNFVLVIALCFGVSVGVPLSVSAATTTPTFDTPSEWAAERVNAAIKAGLVPAEMQSAYTQATTRAEFAALAVTLYENVTGIEIADRTSFSDTIDVNVEKAAAIGVVTGIGNNVFSPDAQLTREQAALMLSRLADAVGSPLTGHGQGDDFADSANISDWAIGAVKQVQAAGIMGGVGANTFAPRELYTRDQSIVTMLRFWDMMNAVTTVTPTPRPHVRGPGRTPTPSSEPTSTPEPNPEPTPEPISTPTPVQTTAQSVKPANPPVTSSNTVY